MIVSFTGSRKGMTPEQKIAFGIKMGELEATRLVHGDCVGADEEAHEIASRLGCEIHIRPCTLEDYRAWCWGAAYVAEPLPPLVRNKNIVMDGDVLIVAPDGPEKVRSGTWSTVRYARSNGVRVIVINPDGSVIDSADED